MRWDEGMLPEPKICGVRVKPLCFVIAFILMAENLFNMYAVNNVWHYNPTKPYQLITACLMMPSILTCLCLVVGLVKDNSTTMAVFLWGYLEIELLYMTFFSYMAITDTMHDVHYWSYYVFFVIKCGMWWTVNMYHNWIKEPYGNPFLKLVRFV